jgi:hypothetical protein
MAFPAPAGMNRWLKMRCIPRTLGDRTRRAGSCKGSGGWQLAESLRTVPVPRPKVVDIRIVPLLPFSISHLQQSLRRPSDAT